MVTLGDEGFMDGGGDGAYPFTKAEGVDFVKNLKIKDLDFGTFHLYPNAWGTSADWGTLWVKEHAAACVAANKPCLFEEYGNLPHPFLVPALTNAHLRLPNQPRRSRNSMADYLFEYQGNVRRPLLATR